MALMHSKMFLKQRLVIFLTHLNARLTMLREFLTLQAYKTASQQMLNLITDVRKVLPELVVQ